MNQLIRMQRHANENTASTLPAITYARLLSSQGKTASQIGIMVRAAGYRFNSADVDQILSDYRRHNEAFRAALEAGE